MDNVVEGEAKSAFALEVNLTPTTLFVLALLGMVVCFVVFRTIPVLRTYFVYRGKWLVNCPETLETQALDVAARTEAASAFRRGRTIRVYRCSRFPKRQNCGQACLKQIAADPGTYLLWNIVSNWYLGQSCVCCHKRFGVLHRLDHALALMRTITRRSSGIKSVPSNSPRSSPLQSPYAGTATSRRRSGACILSWL